MAHRKSTSLTLDRDLLDEARALGVNISRSAEEGVAAAVKAERQRRWKDENREAMESMNRWVEENGVPFNEYRKFGV
ncbi:type II toxin-antitoxin system CcdA family antitoxin [Histidinibacterium aquaticum]|uniref:Post-segregation antitoxin CcdA n=1 Tax=Histidinibacterium aquaticum TaxID=2613962 RepID=A0A5J5GLJ8_9RHOB|nr:type II toxin-antitoxin system CcdA family antitoxin [Histidinibacterium aquaticum]KAA9009226.1 post-segregation antitoxin CcdA [Histidinibacterium aquaticum]